MATNEQDFLDRIRASRMEDILRIAELTSRTPRPRPGAAEQILSIPAVARINRALQPETPEEMAALLGGSERRREGSGGAREGALQYA